MRSFDAIVAAARAVVGELSPLETELEEIDAFAAPASDDHEGFLQLPTIVFRTSGGLDDADSLLLGTLAHLGPAQRFYDGSAVGRRAVASKHSVLYRLSLLSQDASDGAEVVAVATMLDDELVFLLSGVDEERDAPYDLLLRVAGIAQWPSPDEGDRVEGTLGWG